MKALIEEIYSKSTICDFVLMVTIVTVAVLFTVCETSWRKKVENRHFANNILFVIVDSYSEGTPSNIKVIYTSLKSTFSGSQFCR